MSIMLVALLKVEPAVVRLNAEACMLETFLMFQLAAT
jgi:hypothetical protein